jgi:hypothetical protein
MECAPASPADPALARARGHAGGGVGGRARPHAHVRVQPCPRRRRDPDARDQRCAAHESDTPHDGDGPDAGLAIAVRLRVGCAHPDTDGQPFTVTDVHRDADGDLVRDDTMRLPA